MTPILGDCKHKCMIGPLAALRIPSYVAGGVRPAARGAWFRRAELCGQKVPSVRRAAAAALLLLLLLLCICPVPSHDRSVKSLLWERIGGAAHEHRALLRRHRRQHEPPARRPMPTSWCAQHSAQLAPRPVPMPLPRHAHLS